ncbi:MAG TPA: NAD(+) diphosphatase [Methylomirabilota bacterium]|jgi:NAD+ diphosphatase|nr:NAD(+) diphosphatase [Methylomirabilota bacterium]
MRTPNHYAGSSLDRAHLKRRDEAWLRERLAHPDSAVLPLWHGQPLVSGAEAPAPGLIAASEVSAALLEGEWALLGIAGERAVFALDLPGAGEEPPDFSRWGRFADLRQVGPILAREDAALLAYARGLMLWHERHRFCGVCGAATRSVEGGHQRRCTKEGCGAVHFPRTDPAVIMLVTSGGKALLGRQAAWPAGMHSTLAGFVEPGESLEEAVAREVMEEVGVPVSEVRYHSSQPWPFPASIMLGFTARALEEKLRLNPEEIEHAAWFTRAELRDSPEDERLRLPRRDSIAYRLIRDWIEKEG